MKRVWPLWVGIVLVMAGVAALWRLRGHSVSVERVAARLNSPNRRVRLETAESLGKIRVPATVPAIVARMRVEEDREIREALCFALGQTGTHLAARALAQLADDPDPTIAARARRQLDAIYRKPLPKDLSALRAHVEREPPPAP